MSIRLSGIFCGHLPMLLNGQITMEKTFVGEVAKYSCNDNYYLAGTNVRYCLNNGTWSGSQPECLSKLYVCAFIFHSFNQFKLLIQFIIYRFNKMYEIESTAKWSLDLRK